MTWAGRTALVIGSTGGIGLGIAELLAKAGADFVLKFPVHRTPRLEVSIPTRLADQ